MNNNLPADYTEVTDPTHVLSRGDYIRTQKDQEWIFLDGKLWLELQGHFFGDVKDKIVAVASKKKTVFNPKKPSGMTPHCINNLELKMQIKLASDQLCDAILALNFGGFWIPSEGRYEPPSYGVHPIFGWGATTANNSLIKYLENKNINITDNSCDDVIEACSEQIIERIRSSACNSISYAEIISKRHLAGSTQV
jgi:hypothetical protein